MIHLPVSEAKNRLSETIVRAEAGEEAAINRRGKPVVNLIAAKPIHASSQRERVEAAFRQPAALGDNSNMHGDPKTTAREGLH